MAATSTSNTLFLNALKDVAQRFPQYFFFVGPLDAITDRWDIQPNYAQLEQLLLEEEAPKHFVFNVWSFFSSIGFEKNSLAEMIRPLDAWQKSIICQLITNDNVN